MALFSKESKDEKMAAKAAAILDKYGLENVNDPQTLEALREIAVTMSANKFLDAGALLTGKSEDVAMLGYLRTIVEQNFILIRQLDKLAR